MYLTGRFVALLLLGAVPTIIVPEYYVVALWIIGALVLAGVDFLAAGSTGALRIVRRPTDPIRLGESTSSTLIVENNSGRRFRGRLRDAWQPSAGATGNRHDLDIPGGERVAVRTGLTPTRRGDRLALRVTVRRRGPLGLAGRQHSLPMPGFVRALPPFGSRRHLPSRLARLPRWSIRGPHPWSGHRIRFAA